ncbi:MAG TPA: VOC family protein [Blastocatellia bacterium]|nr:VOC family protein [Blastocatellia bacterium]
MKRYVEANHQLVVELYTRNLEESLAFYTSFGFDVARKENNFAVLTWDDSQLFIEEVKDAPRVDVPVGNIRVMVADVDRYWELARQLGARVIRPIEDRYYGLRDFTIAGPDGLGLRFATRLEDLR